MPQLADQDGSGSVDFEEFLTATVNHAAVREERLKRVFQVYDRDHSGPITVDELAAALGDLQVRWQACRQAGRLYVCCVSCRQAGKLIGR